MGIHSGWIRMIALRVNPLQIRSPGSWPQPDLVMFPQHLNEDCQGFFKEAGSRNEWMLQPYPQPPVRQPQPYGSQKQVVG